MIQFLWYVRKIKTHSSCCTTVYDPSNADSEDTVLAISFRGLWPILLNEIGDIIQRIFLYFYFFFLDTASSLISDLVEQIPTIEWHNPLAVTFANSESLDDVVADFFRCRCSESL